MGSHNHYKSPVSAAVKLAPHATMVMKAPEGVTTGRGKLISSWLLADAPNCPAELSPQQ